jgi:hypothetical protein
VGLALAPLGAADLARQLASPPLRDRYPTGRIQQFEFSRGIFRFPDGPAEIAEILAAATRAGNL